MSCGSVSFFVEEVDRSIQQDRQHGNLGIKNAGRDINVDQSRVIPIAVEPEQIGMECRCQLFDLFALESQEPLPAD